MANTTADEQQTAAVSRPHARANSSGNQSSNIPLQQSQSLSNIPSTPTSSSTPTASTTALPRAASTAAGTSNNVTSTTPNRLLTSHTSLRSATAASISGQGSPGSSRASTSSSTTSTAIPTRRDTFGSSSTHTSNSETRPTASSYLSTAHSTPTAASSSSLFGFLGGHRPTADDSNVNHPYGWRAMSASNPSFNYASNQANASSSSAATNATSETTNVYNSHRSLAPQTTSSFQSRPAITSFLASSGQGGYAWNTVPNRGATVGALQQMHQQQQQHNQNLVGSPARSHALVNGSSPPWMGTPQGQYGNITGSTSGWTLTDPVALGAWARSGKMCSGFEENHVVSFTWVISEANLLRDEVEKSPLQSEGGRSISAGAGKSEVWTTQPIFGDGKWKLELVRTSRPASPSSGAERQAPEIEEAQKDEVSSPTTTVLSVYLTNLVLDYSAADLEIPANIMIGIKPVQSQSRSSRSGSWIWQEFVHYVFRRESEFYECHQLPSLSNLLQDADIERQDAFSLTIQISTGPRAAAKSSEQGLGRISDSNQASPFIVQDSQLVHHSLINGLERLLDCRATGDVVLIVRERGVVKRQRRNSDETASQDEVWTRPVGTPMFDWGQSQEDVQVVVRDRLLWAHSSILSARSEFFRDMLQSSFSEGQEIDIGGGSSIQIQGRRVRTLRITDADFTTIYWLLRYLYLEEVEFISNEDVRCAALDDDWMAVGQNPTDEGLRMAVWQWTPLSQVDEESALHGKSSSRHASASGPTSPDMRHNPTSPNRSKSTIVPHETYGSHQRRVASDRDSRHSARSSTQEAPSPDTHAPPTTAKKEDFIQHSPLFLDPHLHPCEKPPPASALAIYRLAHRYHQEGLVHLAKVQLIGSLTPHTAFPTLLATNLYSDLYEHVKAYVLDKWDLVSQTSEFEQCCDEVSAGEWGVEAGRALRLFMRSLLSPSRAR